MKKLWTVSALFTLALGVTTVMAATTSATTSAATKTLTYQEEGMTVSKRAYDYTSVQGYSLDVMSEYRASRQGAYDVFTMKTDPKVWFSVIKLPVNANFSRLAVPAKQHLASIGTLNEFRSDGQVTLEASNFTTHAYEEYIFTTVHHQPFRFHIVHESDWESNAPFTAMLKTMDPMGHSNGKSGISYNIGYFATNRNMMVFHIGNQAFFSSRAGNLQIHEGDTVGFTADVGVQNSPRPVKVNRVLVTSGTKSIRVTKTGSGQFRFTAVKPGTVALNFRRGSAGPDGSFSITIVNE